MSNEELFQKVKDLKLPQGRYALFGSTTLAIRGIRASNDADIVVTESLYQELKSIGKWKTKLILKNIECLTNEDGDIEILKSWGPGEWNIEKLIFDAETIDDLPLVSLSDVLRWKKLNGREKDLKDVELITEYIKNNGK